jgi:hypothetical protein
MAASDLKIRASANLGGLGDTEGPAVIYSYSPASILPQFLPWLAIVALLLLKPNRSGQAWWIFLPLALVAGTIFVLQTATPSNADGAYEALCQMITALAFGLAAVWLLASYLKQTQRALTMLIMLPTLAIFSLFTYFMSVGIQDRWSDILPYLISLPILSLVLALALTLAGLCCRLKPTLPRLNAWLILWLLLFCFVIMIPFYLIAWFASGRQIPLLGFIVPVLIATAMCFGVFVPFLILSRCNSLYRERLQTLLHQTSPAETTAAMPPLPPSSPV